ncbi:copper chaperone PCu(A)C [Streptomyces minutiscleroticus]|uniref:Copper chaperone PCu(A)C n=1 Tax=Streptomyces minutiscleroticus TaxID=68238 RepID=A0A918U1S8_9ACTN|nr:copper chaperone PCu(A)C [Streptomyces minutiscleroticus]GGX82379.1 hypothetical protein GCM10010358_40690 [Streptomyces minutiscleroticus]
MRRRAAVCAAVLLAAAPVLTGCGADSGGAADLSVRASYMPQPMSDTMAAGFLTVVNDGGEDDELSSVTSDLAGEVTIHRTVDGRMEEVDRLDVPAHGEVVLESGGDHLMFEKLERRPTEGEKVSVTLHFAGSGTIEVEMPVKSATYRPTSAHH